MKKKLTLEDVKVKSFQTSDEKSKIIGGADTITNCLCSQTFWVPCDCGGGGASNPDWTCGPFNQIP